MIEILANITVVIVLQYINVKSTLYTLNLHNVLCLYSSIETNLKETVNSHFLA